MVLSCLTNDVEWVIPGMFHIRGKEAFDKEIENEAFTGSPRIVVTRLAEENDVVFAEGTVRAQRKDGGVLHLVFCDAFEMAGAQIKKLTSYLMEVNEETNQTPDGADGLSPKSGSTPGPAVAEQSPESTFSGLRVSGAAT
jgi:uncharacterized protein